MTQPERDLVSGYRIEAIYRVLHTYTIVDQAAVDEEDTGIAFGWNWRIAGPRTLEVLLDVALKPTKALPESIEVQIVGRFVAGEKLSLAPHDFVRLSAPAIIMPYIRQAISESTGHGPFHARHLPPMNMVEVMAEMDFEETIGAKQLADDPEENEWFVRDVMPPIEDMSDEE